MSGWAHSAWIRNIYAGWKEGIRHGSPSLAIKSDVCSSKTISSCGNSAWSFPPSIKVCQSVKERPIGRSSKLKSRIQRKRLFCSVAQRDHLVWQIDFGIQWGLSDSHFDENWSSLSGGEMQRAALAVALALNPEVLLLDGKEASCHLWLYNQYYSTFIHSIRLSTLR